MLQQFSLTWIDVLLFLFAFAVLFVSFRIRTMNIHKAFAFFMHPITLLVGFVVIAINFSHY